MTTHRERIRAVLRGEVIDRPPVALWRHFPVDDQDPGALAEAHAAFQSLYDFDLIKITPASSFCLRDWGVEDVWEGHTEGTRRYTKTVVHEPADWERLPVLQPAAKNLAQQLECIEQLRIHIGQDVPMLQTIFSPLAQAKHLAGEAALLRHARESRDALLKGLQTITETTKLFIRAARAAGIDGIFYAIQHARADLFSASEYRTLSGHLDIDLLNEAAKLECNMVHLHGANVLFDVVSDYPAQAINWHDRETPPSLAAALSRWPGVLCGGLSLHSMVYGNPDAILHEAHEALEVVGGRRLILSTGCVVPMVAPYGNVAAARRAVEAWRPPSGRTMTQ